MSSTAVPSATGLRMDEAALAAFFVTAFPDVPDNRRPHLIAACAGHVRMQLTPDASNLRPGNIVAGPTLMGLADHVAYALVLAHIGPVAMAVTSALNFHFLRACEPMVITADARLLRLGKRLVVSDVLIWTTSPDRPVAQATVTYALPDPNG